MKEGNVMKKLKKCTVAFIMMALMLTGCGEPSTSTTSAPAGTAKTEATTTAAEEKKTESNTTEEDADSCIGDDALVY